MVHEMSDKSPRSDGQGERNGLSINDWISDEIWDAAEDRQPDGIVEETRDSLADTLLEDVSQADTAETMLPPELSHLRRSPPRSSH